MGPHREPSVPRRPSSQRAPRAPGPYPVEGITSPTAGAENEFHLLTFGCVELLCVLFLFFLARLRDASTPWTRVASAFLRLSCSTAVWEGRSRARVRASLCGQKPSTPGCGCGDVGQAETVVQPTRTPLAGVRALSPPLEEGWPAVRTLQKNPPPTFHSKGRSLWIRFPPGKVQIRVRGTLGWFHGISES